MLLCTFNKKQFGIVGCIIFVGLVALGGCLALFLNRDRPLGGIVTNGYECASIGRDIILKGGSVADAGIAAMLCEGVAMPQSTGIGGGFLLTIYTKETGVVDVLSSREVAPAAATEDMFKNDPSLSAKGGLAVAVPGELRGFEALHKKYGKLPWEDVLQPTIDLCTNGHLVTKYLANVFKNYRTTLKNTESLREVFINPETNEPWIEGDIVKRPQLAKTLKIVAKEGADALYNGSLTKEFVKDIQKFNGIITVEDMNNYKPQWLKPIVASLPGKQTLYTFPLPGSGLIMNFIMSLNKNYLDLTNINSITNWQRIVESFKFAYGKRTQLGDPDFVDGIEELVANLTSPDYINEIRKQMLDNKTFQDPMHYGANFSLTEDHGTAHISVLAPNGDAISITGTINLIFGSQRRSQSTGIILNDEMDDFSSNFTNSFGVPPSPANFIKPGKRPMSSMCPSIIVNEDGSVRLVIGAAGGTKISTSTPLVAMKHLWFGQTLDEALNSKRLHHQLFPMSITFESEYDQTIVDGLSKIGHFYTMANAESGFAAVTGIANNSGIIEAVSDDRRSGSEVYLP